jgi:hypothetical protein
MQKEKDLAEKLMKCRGDFTERKIFFKNQTFTYTMA